MLLLLLQSSCWDKVEVEQLAIVMAMAVDKGEDDLVRATVQVINPKGIAGGGGAGGMGNFGGDNKAYRNLSNHGETIFDAVRGMGGNIPRELYFSHNQVIIISEEIARQGILKVIDFFDRNPQIRRNNWLLISKKDVNQYELLNAPNSLERVPAQRINGIIKERERTVSFAITQLGDFMELMAEKGIEAYTAGVKLSPNAATLEALGTARGEEENEETRDINVTQTAVFRGDKLVGWLNERESRGLVLVREGFNTASYSIEVGSKGGNVAVEALKGKAQIKPVITEDGEPVFNIKASVQGTVSEVSDFIDLTKPENFNIIQKKLEQAIKKDIMQALEKTQQDYRADVFGLGSALYRRYPEYWHKIADRWPKIYSEVEVTVDIEAKVPRIGLVSKPVKVDGE